MKFLSRQPFLPLVTILVHGSVYGLIWALITPEKSLLMAAIFATLLIWVSTNDIKTFEIPDTAVVLLISTGLLFAYQSHQLWNSIIAATLWGGIFLTISQCFKILRGFDGLGLGDVKLMAGLGAWLGYLAPIFVILSASLSAIAVTLVLSGLNKEKQLDSTSTGIAFGPFLCLSAWAVWLKGIVV